MADIFIRNVDWLVTVDGDRRIFTDGALVIQGDRIIAVGKTYDLEAEHASSRHIIDGRGKVVLPGLIDAHIHTAFQLSRGLADEVSAQKFLFERMYPYEGLLTEEESYWSAMLCVLELLRNGVTTFIDAGNYQPHQTARVAGEAGVRCGPMHYREERSGYRQNAVRGATRDLHRNYRTGVGASRRGGAKMERRLRRAGSGLVSVSRHPELDGPVNFTHEGAGRPLPHRGPNSCLLLQGNS